MKSITGKKFARVLEEHGWVLLRVHGSHHIYGMEGRIERISIPIHGNKSLKIGLVRHLMKIAALDEKDFDE